MFCLFTSYNVIPAETETLSESTNPNIGILINSSELSSQNFDIPELSEPKTMADEFPNLIFSKLFFELRDVAKILNLLSFKKSRCHLISYSQFLEKISSLNLILSNLDYINHIFHYLL